MGLEPTVWSMVANAESWMQLDGTQARTSVSKGV